MTPRPFDARALASTPRGAAGFTLVEVLVAVAVLAIALSAVISAMARQADNAGYLRQKTLALWVAHNRMTELQLQEQWPELGRSDGKVEMGGVEWRWEAVVVKTDDDKLRRVDLSVQGPGQRQGSLARLSGFVTPRKAGTTT